MPSRAKLALIRFMMRVRSPTRHSRSRFGRLASSSAVLVEMRAAGFGAAGIGRVQCQLGQKTLAGGGAGGDLLELIEVSGARRRIIVEAFKLRPIPLAHQLDLTGPRRSDIAQALDHAAKPRPRHECGGRRCKSCERRGGEARVRELV